MPIEGKRVRISGWSRLPSIDAQVFSCESCDDIRECLSGEGRLIAHALGRSYGDSALAPSVIHTLSMDRILEFDANAGVVRCQAGTPIEKLVKTVLPHGWFLPVTPGTSQVTVGGAIASDVHGKNHHVAGCFGEWVEEIELVTADGDVRRCSRLENSDLFRATCGGMGLTGVITSATLRLKRVNSAYMITKRVRAASLDEACEQFERFSGWPYLVAWVDCFPSNGTLGRCIVLMGDHSDKGGLDDYRPGFSPRCPSFFSRFLNRFSARTFNTLYYRVSAGTRAGGTQVVPLSGFFYPLDRISGWNRLYGKAGPIQYQFVMPYEACPNGLYAVFKKIVGSRHVPFLGVLKLFGKQNQNMLSFPMEGYTLALDFPLRKGLFELFCELDRIVADHGGRLYLAKDSRMGLETFEAGYPARKRFVDIRERYGLRPRFGSLQSIRLEL